VVIRETLAAPAKERVKNGPGAIAITRMPCSARSRAMVERAKKLREGRQAVPASA